jgi:hypothetical protein
MLHQRAHRATHRLGRWVTPHAPVGVVATPRFEPRDFVAKRGDLVEVMLSLDAQSFEFGGQVSASQLCHRGLRQLKDTNAKRLRSANALRVVTRLLGLLRRAEQVVTV